MKLVVVGLMLNADTCRWLRVRSFRLTMAAMFAEAGPLFVRMSGLLVSGVVLLSMWLPLVIR